MSDLATVGDEIPLLHKHLKHKLKRESCRSAGSSAGNSEAEVEVEPEASPAGGGAEASELEGRVASMEAKLDALTASTSRLTDL